MDADAARPVIQQSEMLLGVQQQQQGAVAAKDCATVERVIQKVRFLHVH